MSKKTKNITIAAGLFILLLGLASPKLKFLKSDAPTDRVSAGGMRLPVTAIVISPQPLSNKIVSTGTVIANEEVELQSEVSGKITQLLFKEGSQVKKSDLLVKINDAELQAQLQKQEFQRKLAEEVEYRQRMLLQKEAVSQEEYDTSLKELNTILAEITLIKAQIAKTEIRASFDGVIGLRYVSEGAFISSNTRIASLLNIDPVKVDFSVPEKYANVVEKGDEINFTIEAVNAQYRGSVYAIEPKIDPVTRTVQIRAICPNEAGRILPGSFARVDLTLEKYDNALLIPTEALIPELGGQRVYLYHNGSAVPQAVETGIRTDKQIQIVRGLQPSDTVITSGILQLRPGLAVNITEMDQE